MPRQYFDIREDEQLSIKIRKYPCLFNKIGSDMHGQKLMINWELKQILPYAMKRYCIKNKNTKSFLFLISYSIFFFFLSFLYLRSEFVVASNSFLSVNTSQNWATNLKRQTGYEFIDLSGNQALKMLSFYIQMAIYPKKTLSCSSRFLSII